MTGPAAIAPNAVDRPNPDVPPSFRVASIAWAVRYLDGELAKIDIHCEDHPLRIKERQARIRELRRSLSIIETVIGVR